MNDSEIVDKIRRYLSPPDAMSNLDYDTSKESIVAQLIAEKIKSLGDEDNLSILDVGCGKASILTMLKSEDKFKDDTHKLFYHGIDMNNDYICQLKYLEDQDKETKWKINPLFTTCGVLDYRPEENEFYDIILVLNFIHEFDPAYLPELFIKLNQMLKTDGVIIIVDMENLPFGEEESQSICFNRAEIKEILISAGVKSAPITHKKRVNLWSLSVQKSDIIDEEKCIKKIKTTLENKLDNMMNKYNLRIVSTERKWDNDYIYEWICLTSHICQLNACLRNIKSKFDGNNNQK